MTPIHREQINHRIAWRGSDFRSKEDIAYDLTPAHVAALKDVLLRVKDVPLDDIQLAHCAHPALDKDLAGVLDEVMDGRGIVLVRGFPIKEHSVDEIEKMYWAFTRHLGVHLSQNSFGHKMVRVQQEVLPGGVQPARGTKSANELAMHNDGGDIFSLLYVYQAEQGGESQFSSGPAAHNEILATRPDILPILYKGFPHHRRSDQPDHQPVVSPYDVPIFSNVDGRISINFTYSSILPALYELGRKPTEQEAEAMDILRDVLMRQQLEIRAESGEMSVVNNFAACHSRSGFVDGNVAEKRRLVMRTALEVPSWRRRLPIHLGREFYQMENEGGRLSLDKVPGREGRIARNDYVGVNEELANLFKATQVKPKPRSTATH
jgi:hypothetical protein